MVLFTDVRFGSIHKVHRALSAPGGINPEGDCARTAAVYDASEVVPEVPMEWFQTYVLPPLLPALAQDSLDSVIKQLVRRGTLTKSGMWAEFSVEPQQRHGPGFQVATTFMGVVSDIGKAAQAVLPYLDQHVEFKCNPNMTLISKHRRDASRPDTFGVYKGHRCASSNTKRPGWEVLVVPGEFKKADSTGTRDDNVRKILWSFKHIMREDVRRRFVIGYTIDDSFMRLWFCSRADLLVTEEFDFMAEPRIVTHFFLSQMYPSESQLGYDTTIRYPAEVSLHGKQWDIDVRVWVVRRAALSENNKGKGKEEDLDEGKYDDGGRPHGKGKKRGSWVTHTYRTSKVLSNVGAESLRGRGTRVWEVSKLAVTADGRLEPLAGEKPVVLKDSWIDDDREREAVTREQILRSTPPDLEPFLAKHLLTVECYGDVASDSSGFDTRDTTAQMRSGQPVPTDSYFTLEDDSTKLPTESDLTSTHKLSPPPRVVEFDDKCHHRTVFKEVGRPIDTLNSVFEIVSILSQAVLALGFIHQCGWIHRDISGGNILIVPSENGDVVKIADLEYTKRVSDKTRPNLQTGTVQYMAVETKRHKYIFRPTSHTLVPDSSTTEANAPNLVDYYKELFLTQPEGLASSKPAPTPTVPVPKATPCPFYHNPLHDVESLWWLAVRLILVRLIVAQSLRDINLHWDLSEALELAKRQEAYFDSVFYNDAARSAILQEEGTFVEGQQIVHPKLLELYNSLDETRQELKCAYVNAEKDVASIDHTVGQGVLSSFFKKLRKLRDHYEGSDDLQFEPIEGPVKKTTPEDHAALPLGLSLDSRLPKRLRGDLGSSLDPSIPSSDPGDIDFEECIRAAKRIKVNDAEAQTPQAVVGSSTILGAASVEIELPGAESSECVGSGKGKTKEKGKEKRKETAKDTAKAKVPTTTRRRTQAAPAGLLRRSTRARKTTQ